MLTEPRIGHHRLQVSVLSYIGEVTIHTPHRHVLKPTKPSYLRKGLPNIRFKPSPQLLITLLLCRYTLVATLALNKLEQSLWCASVAYSFHPHHMPTNRIKRTRRSRQNSLWDAYLMFTEVSITKFFKIWLAYNLGYCENRVQVQSRKVKS